MQAASPKSDYFALWLAGVRLGTDEETSQRPGWAEAAFLPWPGTHAPDRQRSVRPRVPSAPLWPRPMPESSSNITVAVRVRPLSVKEKARQSWNTVDVIDDTHVQVCLARGGPLTRALSARARAALYQCTAAPPVACTQVNDPDDKMGGIDYLRLDKTKTKHYRFDFALGPESAQTEVYEKTNKPLVEKALQGYNACCFAYGASACHAPLRSSLFVQTQTRTRACSTARMARVHATCTRACAACSRRHHHRRPERRTWRVLRVSADAAAEGLSADAAAEGLSAAAAAEDLSADDAAEGLSAAAAAEGLSADDAAEGLSADAAAEGLSAGASAEGVCC